MAEVNAAKLVAGTDYGFSFFERRAIVGRKSHLCTSTRGSILPGDPDALPFWASYRARIGPKCGRQLALGPNQPVDCDPGISNQGSGIMSTAWREASATAPATLLISSGLPKSETASSIELEYFRRNNGASFSGSSSSTPTPT
jgi:hypothetical protein